MANALTLVILLAASDADDPRAPAVVHAAEQSLGSEVAVRVRAVPHDASREAIAVLAITLHADAVAELAWTDAERSHATLHMYVSAERRWIDRDMAFSPSDAPAEQGRTLGFVIASMLPELPPHDSPAQGPEAPALTPSERTRAREAATPTAPRRWIGAIDIVAQGAASFGGDAGGWGGALSGQWSFMPPFALRLGAQARFGQVGRAQATSLALGASAGIAWHILPRPSLVGSRFGLSARIDAMLLRQSLTHLSADDPAPVEQSRWLPGADAALEGTWFFTESAALLMALGTETSFGSTTIVVHGTQVGTFEPFRALCEMGVRAKF